LKAAGVPEKQAEVQAETMAEFIVGNLATKDDLKYEIKALELRMILKLGGIIAFLLAVFSFLNLHM